MIYSNMYHSSFSQTRFAMGKRGIIMMLNNRWINGAIPAVGIHLSIGAVYAWSVFTNPVMEALNVPLSQVS